MISSKSILILVILVNLIVFIYIIFIHFNENRKDRIKKIKEEEYSIVIDDCIWDMGKCIFGKIKPDQHFIDVIVVYINSYKGEKRTKIIEMAERVGLVDYIYERYKKTWFETDKKRYMYFMGEIRSGKRFQELLSVNIKTILKENVMFEYFFTICRIFQEQQKHHKEEIIETYSQKIYEIFENVDRYYHYEIEKFCNMIILEGVSNFHLEEDTLLKKLFDRVIKSDMSLRLKGDIVYMCALRQINGIKRHLYNKGKELLNKSERNREEDEYLIKIVKAYGELRIKQGEHILREAVTDKIWAVRAAAVKNIKNIEKNREIFIKLLADDNWWVRNNSAETLVNSGKIGEDILVEILESGDKFARETAAYRLSIGEYGIGILRDIFEGKTDMVLEKIEILVNKGNNMNILDIILKERLVTIKDKAKVIEVVKNVKFLEYYESSVKYRNYEEEVVNACLVKLEKLFGEEIIL